MSLCAVAGPALGAESSKYEDPLDDPSIHAMLIDFDRASTWHHPDLFAEFAGIRRYVNKSYVDAMKYFEIGAFFADKFSQMSIGLMYANGEGVPKDPVTAYAWLDLAAERGYPNFVATRERLRKTLSAEQLRQALVVRSTLAQQYGDAVAKPRLSQQLRYGMYQITGSRSGFDFGAIAVATPENFCKGSVVFAGLNLPEAGCGSVDAYWARNWDPDQYFHLRDTPWQGMVTVGDVKPGEPSK